MDTETILRVAGRALPAGTCHGVAETLRPEGRGEVRRTLDGRAVLLGFGLATRLEVRLSGTGVRPPALCDLRTGDAVTVDCASVRSATLPPATDAYALPHDAVPGSVRVATVDGERDQTAYAFERTVYVQASPAVREVRWRPRLACLVTEPLSVDTDEPGARASWSLSLVEAG